jgi:hypothetical protein
MMLSPQPLQRLITILLLLAVVVVVVVSWLPYPLFESLADGFMPDGNFKSLNGGNAWVYRALLAALAAALATLAYGVGRGRLRPWMAWLQRVGVDFRRLIGLMRPAPDEWPFLAALGAIFALALIFRLERINGPMMHDEAYTAVVFAVSTWNAITNYHLPNNHIFHTLLVWLSTRLFGLHPWVARLPALLAGLLLIPATYGLAKTIYDRYTALLAALLVAALNGPIFYATNGRGYSLVALFTLLTWWLAHVVRRQHNRAAWVLLAVFSALGCYTVPVMVFPLGVTFGWLLLENLAERNWRFLRPWIFSGLATVCLTLLLYSPVFIYSGIAKVTANGWVLPVAWDVFWRETPQRWLATWQQWVSGAPSVVPPILVVGFLASLVLHPRLTHQRVPLQGVTILWVGCVLLARQVMADFKVYAFLQAPFLIWAAAGLAGPFKEVRLKFARNVALAGVVAALAIVLVALWGLPIIPTLPAHWSEKGTEERAIVYLAGQISPQDLIIIASPFDAPVWYYARQVGLPDSHFNNQLPFEHLFVIVSPNDAQTPESVLLERGPAAGLWDVASAEYIQNIGYLDIYRVPNR